MDQRDEAGDVEMTSPGTDKAKRQTVAAACQCCRRRKTKCDGQRPCQACQRRGTECSYMTQENETQKQAAKRKYEEVAHARDDLDEIYRLLALHEERDALEVFRRIRRGDNIGSILRFAKHGDVPDVAANNYERQLKQDFLLHLVKTSATLQDMLEIATPFLSSSDKRLSLPRADAFETLKDRMIDAETMKGIVKDANSHWSPQQLPEPRNSLSSPDGTYSGPTFWVPAQPWTRLTSNDEAVSHLVSLFLTFHNPSWRLVEEDLFLQGMRSGRLDSLYCSPLLVNVILAYGSLFSEIDEAFAIPGDPITRGEHFHREAMRLWAQEEGQASLKNLQAIMAMTQESSYRGKDKLGLQLIAAAAQMNRELPMPSLAEAVTPAEKDYVRARGCVAWTVVYTDIQFVTALFKPVSTLSVKLEDASEVGELLPDTTTYWTGYPFRPNPVPLRRNLAFREQCTMTRFQFELVHLLQAEKRRQGDSGLWENVKSFETRFRGWYNGLPKSLHYEKDMPMPLFEFHSQYNYLMMALYKQTLETIYGAVTLEDDKASKDGSSDTLRSQLTTQVLTHAYKAATTVRDYRRAYGLKIFTPHVVQAATLGAFILLQDMRLNPHSSKSAPQARRDVPVQEFQESPVRDTRAAFEECFRCLLAGGTQVMLMRGIARMVVQTATVLEVNLPDDVVQILSIVAEMCWSASDLEQLRSCQPNWAFAKHPGEAGNQMEELLTKWEGLGILDRAMSREDDSSAPAEKGT